MFVFRVGQCNNLWFACVVIEHLGSVNQFFFTMFYHVLTSKVFLGELTTKMDDSFSVTLRSSYFTPVVSIHYGKFSLILPGGIAPPHVFFLYLLNSLFLGAEIFRLFLKFYGESFGIQFELVRFRSLPW